MRLPLLAAFALSAAAASARAQDFPLHLPAPGGEVILPDARSKQSYDETHYAAARRVGDMIYVSGIIVGRRSGEGNDVAAFKLQTRRTLERLKALLEASGTDLSHVAMINSFHVWQGPNFAGTRDEQFKAFEEVLGDYIKPPYPAWTAVGTTGLLADTGVVEVQVIASAPQGGK